MKWFKLPRATGAELNLRNTVLNGQCFSWKPTNTAVGPGEICFTGVIRGNALQLKQKVHGKVYEHVYYRCLNARDTDTKRHNLIKDNLVDYFQLNVSMTDLYTGWKNQCPRMNIICQHIPGMRVLRQEPVECLFSFICSSNNNISRITGMLDKLRTNFGEAALDVNGSSPVAVQLNEDSDSNYQLYCFPTIEALSKISEQELRDMGFGYRAKYITKTAALLQQNGGRSWLMSLREKEHKEVQESLITLHGVGRKVADCVALFSLDAKACIPVDTHVWQIACRYYDPSLATKKSLTPTVYERVNDLFVSRFGDYAGWAHCVLFAAELALFRDNLPESIKEEQDAMKKAEKALKIEKKAAKNAKASATALNKRASVVKKSRSEEKPRKSRVRKKTRKSLEQ